MKLSMFKYCAAVLLLALFWGCSVSEQGSNAPAEPANKNSSEPSVAQKDGKPAAQSAAPQPGAAQPQLPSVQQIPPPQKPEKPGEAVAAAPDANPAAASIAPNGKAPKLIAPPKRVEFGKQAQDKTLVRVISIKNGGKADLNITAVVPS